MFGQLFVLWAVLLSAGMCAGEQVTYTIGGGNVIFVYSSSANVTTVMWPDFGATADSNGALDSGTTAVPPSYKPGPTYAYAPEGIARCVGVASGLAYLQFGITPPAISLFPLNGNDTAWTASQSLVFRAGSASYTNI